MAKTYKQLHEEAEQLDEILGIGTALKGVGKVGKGVLGLSAKALKHLMGTERDSNAGNAVEGKKLPDVEKV